jgi:hypothetical protein
MSSFLKALGSDSDRQMSEVWYDLMTKNCFIEAVIAFLQNYHKLTERIPKSVDLIRGVVK